MTLSPEPTTPLVTPTSTPKPTKSGLSPTEPVISVKISLIPNDPLLLTSSSSNLLFCSSNLSTLSDNSFITPTSKGTSLSYQIVL